MCPGERFLARRAQTRQLRSHKSEFYSDVKEHVLTEANKQKAKKGLKIAGIVFGIILLVDLISFIIYAAVFGLPQ